MASMTSSMTAGELAGRCELLRSLHRVGTPLVLPNAWDVATARAVVAAGFLASLAADPVTVRR